MKNANVLAKVDFNPENQDVEIHPYDPNSDINSIMLAKVPELIDRARSARSNLVDSYRVFVGVSGFAYDPSPEEPRYAYLSGGNYKRRLTDEEFDPEHDVDDIPKNCGEQSIMHAAEEARLKRIGLIVVAATTDRETIEGITGVASSTLHPCKVCQTLFSKKTVVDKNTIILTIGRRENDKFQIMSVSKLLKMYAKLADTGEFKDPSTYDYFDFDWEQAAARYDWRRKRAKKAGKPVGGSENSGNKEQIEAGRRLALKAIHEVID